jgi:hypothetical protein
MPSRATGRLWVAVALAMALAGCATTPLEVPPDDLRGVTAGSVLRSLTIEPALEERILALDPDRISDADVRNVLAKGPTPRIVAIHGGIYPVYLLMESFAQFLIGMGYPEQKIRDPGDGAYSRSPYEDSERQAGEIAWFYEHEGVRPMLIGHSQGGIQVITILHELTGTFGPARRVFNPLSEQFEDRTNIVDPLTGRERPVVGVSVAYASVVGTGGWALALPSSWKVIPIVRSIPDSVDDFTGYRIGLDLFAWDAPGMEAAKSFYANGKANVRNVTLPAAYSHIFVPITAPLAESSAMRAWINDFDPDHAEGRAPLPEGNSVNVMWAADVWHSIKKHWCIEAQRLLQAPRAALAK